MGFGVKSIINVCFYLNHVVVGVGFVAVGLNCFCNYKLFNFWIVILMIFSVGCAIVLVIFGVIFGFVIFGDG